MDNWNHEEALEFISAIEDDVTRTLTKLFLSQFRIVLLQGESPEVDFDLLFFVKVISSTVCEHDMLRRHLDGERLDEGWAGLYEDLDRRERLSEDSTQQQ